jgi:hypothetical protein
LIRALNARAGRATAEAILSTTAMLSGALSLEALAAFGDSAISSHSACFGTALKIFILSPRRVALAFLLFKALANRLGFGLGWRGNLCLALFLQFRLYS